MVRLILFDVDGTLIRSQGAGVKAFERTFATEFNRLDAARQIQFAGRTDPSIVREMFERHQVEPSPDNFQRFFDHYPFWLDHLLSRAHGEICAGVWNFLHRISQFNPPPVLGLLTGNIRLGAEIKLRHFQLWDSFKLGAFGDDHEDRNELARIARKRGCEWLQEDLRGDQIVVVGDTPHDIRCGQAIQARVLAVATGGSTFQELQRHQPTWTVPDLNSLPAEEVCGIKKQRFPDRAESPNPSLDLQP